MRQERHIHPLGQTCHIVSISSYLESVIHGKIVKKHARTHDINAVDIQAEHNAACLAIPVSLAAAAISTVGW